VERLRQEGLLQDGPPKDGQPTVQLSELGLARAEHLLVEGALAACSELTGAVRSLLQMDRPFWDGTTLWWRGHVVKALGAAANQRCVLDAFQAAGWKKSVRVVLPPSDCAKVKVRRRETVRSLNQGQGPAHIKFHADGDGGFSWEVVE
jgi:hypothetical protein